MSAQTPRLRMFAGPNGSGKSTLKSYLPSRLLGIYLNPDEIEEEVRKLGFLDFSAYGVRATADETRKFFEDSSFLKERGYGDELAMLGFADGRLNFPDALKVPHLILVAVEFVRQKLLAQKKTFTFETVMSHPSKVELLRQARGLGYRTYLYFVATDNPRINISRVRSRVRLGGHDVPPTLIVTRYHRSLDLLMAAVRQSNRAYIFDNSSDRTSGTHKWLAEITEGEQLELKTDGIPSWFIRAVLEKIKLTP